MKVHKHIAIKCYTCENASTFSKDYWTSFLENLIYGPLDMECFYGPIVEWCDAEDNEGYSGFALLTTSHIAFHHWPDTGVLELDIFSCKDFNIEAVFRLIDTHVGGGPSLSYKLLDRTGPDIVVLG